MRRIDEQHKCQCSFCRTYDRYIWAVVMECGCGCHSRTDLRPTGHDGLCCEFPDGRKIDNPYDDLKSASVYKEILDLMEEEGNLQLDETESVRYKEIEKKIEVLVNKNGI